MNRHALLVCLISVVLAAASGCCGLHCFLSGPCIPICDPTHCCDTACGACCVDECSEPYCGSCSEPCCDSCSEPCGGSCCDACGVGCGASSCGAACGACWDGYGLHGGPLSWLYTVFFAGYDGPGCGDCYWSDFHSEPPDCCDPCDRHGNWIGGWCGTGCASAPGGDCASGACAVKPVGGGQVERGQVVNKAGPSTNRNVPVWAMRDVEGGVITDRSSPYAPRLLSVTDRAASPTLAQTASTERTAEKQTAVKQATRPRPTPAPR
jgi:hypothetical protein